MFRLVIVMYIHQFFFSLRLKSFQKVTRRDGTILIVKVDCLKEQARKVS